MNVIIRDAAYADLERIYAWIHQDRPAAAASMVKEILDNIERLGFLPYMGHKGRVPGTFEWVVPGRPYIVVYQVDEEQDEIRVIAVVHGAQDR